jgi:predicted regulator of Ras-like GTPase activity (Roadblock/LC7/MglB family)
MTVEVKSERGETVGWLVLKSGRVVDAAMGQLRGMRAVEGLLQCREGRFVVQRLRESPFRDVRSPIGSLGDVLARVLRAANPGSRSLATLAAATKADRVTVMEGILGDEDLVGILQVVGLSRQLTVVEITLHDTGAVGGALVKSGRLLAASLDDLRGTDALYAMFRARAPSRFRVYRTLLTDFDDGFGSIQEVLLQLADRADREAKTAAQRALPPPAAAHAPTPESALSNLLRAIPERCSDTVGASVIRVDGSVVARHLSEGQGGGELRVLLETGELVGGQLFEVGLEQLHMRTRAGHVVVRRLGDNAALVVLGTRQARPGLLLAEMAKTADELTGYVP